MQLDRVRLPRERKRASECCHDLACQDSLADEYDYDYDYY